ncbi:MAG: YtxH domain-containing protein [Candidatus Cohnella colombiensis]|uniref:YtxH domain-containing protein n=1 Tax=Candidatus Cohnella colombiensis TaxID=3121368 RepID=A0AA95EUL1_9BACL|nr:MAG: YtxH domain-containing protein [Cohnella sp.]
MSNKKAFLWGTLTGAITGAVTALLFAPKPGKELRKDIAQTAHKVGEKTVDISRQAGEAVQSFAQRTVSLASDTKQAAGRFITDIRSRKANSSAVVNSNEEMEAEHTDLEDDDQSVGL